MKSSSKILGSILLAAAGLIGIQTQVMADDNHNFQRWGDGEHQQNMRAMQESFGCPSKSTSGRTGSLTASCKACASGALTQIEFFNLMQEQRSIRQQERQYLADDFFGPREYESLNQALNRADEHIRFEKHDQEARYSHPEPRPYGGPGLWSR